MNQVKRKKKEQTHRKPKKLKFEFEKKITIN